MLISPRTTLAGIVGPTAYKPPTEAAPAPAPAPSTGSANLATLPEGMDPNSIPVVDSLSSSAAPGLRWSDQVPVPAGYAPVQFHQANYDLQSGSSYLGTMEGQDLFQYLGLNM